MHAKRETPIRAFDPPPRFSLFRAIGQFAHALGAAVLTVALVVLIAGVVIWFATPYYLRDFLNEKGKTLPDYACHINWVKIHPITASIDLLDVNLKKKSGKIPVPFFDCPKVHIALQWSEILHLSFRSNVVLSDPVVNFVQGPTAATTQTILEPAWVTTVKNLVPLQINRFQIIRGDLHFRDFHAEPPIDLEMDKLELVADNLTNSAKSRSLMPTTVVVSGRPFKKGQLSAELAVNTDMKQPTFSQKLRLDRIPAPALNSFLAKYGSVYAKSGRLDFYTEMVSKDGNFNGYVKPYFADLAFEPVPKDRNSLGAIWSMIANGLKDLLENDDEVVATKIPISGHYDNPDVDFWEAAFGLLRNAYLEALAKGFETPELAPSPVRTAKTPGEPKA